jgi:hypothetical protein
VNAEPQGLRLLAGSAVLAVVLDDGLVSVKLAAHSTQRAAKATVLPRGPVGSCLKKRGRGCNKEGHGLVDEDGSN